jgi:outer membrane protein OmpA-like peptidoglycan-associated protein
MMRRFATISIAAILGLSLVSACTTQNAYTGQSQMSNTSKGALIGAGAGAALGLLVDSSDRAKGALIGAGVGALAGTGVGYYMDQQDAQLRKELVGTGVQVTRQGNNITLIMPGNVTFDTNSSMLKSSFYPVLDSVTKVVKQYQKTILLVAGYTDSTGSASYNQLLSQQRAQSVANYIEAQGVNPKRLVVQGFGESHPIASNDTAEGRAQNRRVELTLEPLTQPGS